MARSTFNEEPCLAPQRTTPINPYPTTLHLMTSTAVSRKLSLISFACRLLVTSSWTARFRREPSRAIHSLAAPRTERPPYNVSVTTSTNTTETHTQGLIPPAPPRTHHYSNASIHQTNCRACQGCTSSPLPTLADFGVLLREKKVYDV